MLSTAILAGVVGGLIWLDKFQALQIMLSRPLVCAPILGWCLGHGSAGLATGILFELLWLRRPPIGGFISPDATFGAITATAVSSCVETPDVNVTSVVFMSFLMVFPLCYVGTRLDAHLRRYLGKIALRAEVFQKDGEEKKVLACFLLALAIGFTMAFLFIFTTTLFGLLVMPIVLSALPVRIVQAASLSYYVVPLVGVADLLVGLQEKRYLIMFLISLGGTVGTLLLLGFRG